MEVVVFTSFLPKSDWKILFSLEEILIRSDDGMMVVK